MVYIGFILGLYWGYIGFILGFYWGYIGVIWGIMEKKMETTIMGYMAGCQNYGPFLGTLNTRCRIIIGTQKGTISLTTTHMGVREMGVGIPDACMKS